MSRVTGNPGEGDCEEKGVPQRLERPQGKGGESEMPP